MSARAIGAAAGSVPDTGRSEAAFRRGDGFHLDRGTSTRSTRGFVTFDRLVGYLPLAFGPPTI
jgi:hypothetical protein